ncbi:hypothetical protein, partial [Bordetella pertussis]
MAISLIKTKDFPGTPNSFEKIPFGMYYGRTAIPSARLPAMDTQGSPRSSPAARRAWDWPRRAAC